MLNLNLKNDNVFTIEVVARIPVGEKMEECRHKLKVLRIGQSDVKRFLGKSFREALLEVVVGWEGVMKDGEPVPFDKYVLENAYLEIPSVQRAAFEKYMEVIGGVREGN